MARRSVILFLFLLIILMCSCAHGVNIQLYKEANFTELYLQSYSTADCNPILWDKTARVKSLRTDLCFIANHGRKCKSRDGSVKYLAGEYPIVNRMIQSFYICNDKEGGGQLNVDITKHFHNSAAVPYVLESYKNVCSCVYVPTYVQNMKWAMDNHHNDLLAYFEPNCSENMWNHMFIIAGHNWFDSAYMHSHNKTDSLTNTTYKIQSFGPAPKSFYFKNSCKSFQVKPYANKTEIVKNVNVDYKSATELDTDVKQQVQILTARVSKLETQVDQLIVNQVNFQNPLPQQQISFFNKFTEKITELLEQKFDKFTEKLKIDMHEICA